MREEAEGSDVCVSGGASSGPENPEITIRSSKSEQFEKSNGNRSLHTPVGLRWGFEARPVMGWGLGGGWSNRCLRNP